MKLTRRNLFKSLLGTTVAAIVVPPPTQNLEPGIVRVYGEEKPLPWLCSGYVGDVSPVIKRYRDARGRFARRPKIEVL